MNVMRYSREAVKKSALLASAAVGCIGVSPLGLAQEGAEATSQEARAVMDVVTVTSRQREENLQDVPISVSAITGAALESQGIGDFANLATTVPGLALQEGGPGFRTVYVRGIAAGAIGTTPTTGFYYDESYVEPGGLVTSIVEPIFFDVDRVEVLRGPQGTLFGGGAMGGVLRFLSNKPVTDEFEAAAGIDLSATEEGGFNYQLDGMVNIPIVEDRVALRAVSSYRSDEGYIDRLVGDFSGPDRTAVGPITKEDNINDSEFQAHRGILTAQLTENLTATLTGVYQETESDALAVIDDDPGDLRQRRTYDIDDPLTDEFVLGNLLLVYEGDSFELLSTTTVSDRDLDFAEDGSDVIWGFTGGRPTRAIGNRKDESFTQEFRITSDFGGSFEAVAGIFYEEDTSNRETSFDIENPGVEATAEFLEGDFFRPLTLGSMNDREQIAIFGEGVYDLTDALSLTLGARYYDIDLSQTPLRGTTSFDSQEDGINPRVILSYDMSDENMIYASASRGFRPGTTNVPLLSPLSGSDLTACQAEASAIGLSVDEDGVISPVESDSLWTYEGGIKSQSTDGRFTINASAYFSDWSNIQLQTRLASCGTFVRANAGEAEVKGIELEFSAALTELFNVSGGVTYTDAELTKDVPGSAFTAGQSLTSIPDWSANLNVQYQYPKPIGPFAASVIFNARYVGESEAQILPRDEGPVQEDYALLNLRAGLTQDDLRFDIYINNLTNEVPQRTYFETSYGLPFEYDKYFTERPRTIGVSVRKDF